MDDPYAVLDLERGADEAAIRRRYLELVRQYPPERAPERFAAVRAAYDELRDPVKRLERRLFRPDAEDSLGAIQAEIRERIAADRIPVDRLLELAGRV
jgi:curved DNA-binding protein CbpA